MNQNDAWDREYRRHGRLYGGAPRRIPPLRPGSRILDLGCGDGRMIAALRGKGYRVTGVDRSFVAAAICRARCTGPDDAGIVVADATCTPFPDAAFDVVFSFHLAGHLTASGRHELAREVFRLLVPGGRLFFEDFSNRDLRFGKGNETEPRTFLRKNGIATHYFTRDEISALFSGFAILALDPEEWEMRVRGRSLLRAGFFAVLEKPGITHAPQTLSFRRVHPPPEE